MLKQAMKGMMGKGGGMTAGMPTDMDPKQLEAAAKQMGAKMPGGGGLPGLGGSLLPPGLSGFGKKK